MRPRILTRAVLVVAVLTAATVSIGGAPSVGRQKAVFYLAEHTLIGSTIVQGPVRFVHDDRRMLRGEPCTSVYLVEPGKGDGEEIASFHCIPRARQIVGTFTVRTRPNLELGFGCILTEYQFAGDTEGHGVPEPPRLAD
jgi:hypothetical protein